MRPDGVDTSNIVRSKRVPVPSTKLLDKANDAEQLPTHQRAVVQNAGISVSPPTSRASSPPHDQYQEVIDIDLMDDEPKSINGKSGKAKKGASATKRKVDDQSDETVDREGLLADVVMDELLESSVLPGKARCEARKDLDHFWVPDGDDEKKSICTLCQKMYNKNPKEHRKLQLSFVKDNTTRRRHLERFHQEKYNQWCLDRQFQSKLPDMSAARRKAENEAKTQGRLDGHLAPRVRETVFTQEKWTSAAVKWLVATDQPLSVFQNAYFQAMIDLSSRAPPGCVEIPSRKVVCAAIIGMFKEGLFKLRDLFQSDHVPGEVHLAADCWQADNVDAYFCVTASFIEIRGCDWLKRTVIIGFALYRVVRRLCLESKVGFVTCDNASNNDTMMSEFAFHIEFRTGRKYNGTERRLRCLAHIVNLPTQTVIKEISASKCYDPHNPDAHLPDLDATLRNVIGIVCAICVKERSSPQRKELFKVLQEKAKTSVVYQLILDMIIRWSSTHAMLHCAFTLRKARFVDEFVMKLARAEKNSERSAKLSKLSLNAGEWERVRRVISILENADATQQAFLSDMGPCMHLVIPALEMLHRQWFRKCEKENYAEFKPALEQALEKLEGYYNKVTDSAVYIFSMLLDPMQKSEYFSRHWDQELQREVRDASEEIFRVYWELHGGASAQETRPKKKAKYSGLQSVASDDEDNSPSSSHDSPFRNTDSSLPWLNDFKNYVEGKDIVPDGQSIIEWWSYNHQRFHPAWRSLALTYLAILAASVSCERAFSSSGITVSDRRNRLKGDIVEALQFMKCSLRQELLFRKFPSASNEPLLDPQEGPDKEMDGLCVWDDFLPDEPDEGEDDEDIVIEPTRVATWPNPKPGPTYSFRPGRVKWPRPDPPRPDPTCPRPDPTRPEQH
ncbi:unnamed protein product [Mycena citricolor]|uniref:HAT C-terminal dimerisation domain-containing protein n=1 Tax=Mycena citricolor TaxID=2018698 RepID=A0AAD2HRH9_9AGAR|nr:unnamed protein product [Mycena citricolor]